MSVRGRLDGKARKELRRGRGAKSWCNLSFPWPLVYMDRCILSLQLVCFWCFSDSDSRPTFLLFTCLSVSCPPIFSHIVLILSHLSYRCYSLPISPSTFFLSLLCVFPSPTTVFPYLPISSSLSPRTLFLCSVLCIHPLCR